MKTLSIMSLFLVSLAHASPISIIYVDEATEKKIGDWPISRDYYAKALKIIFDDQRARIAVLKIFLDSDKPQDDVLAETLKKYPYVYTQALAVEEDERWKDKIPLKVLGPNTFNYEDSNSGWFPNKKLAPHFRGVGLVNGKDNEKEENVGFYIVNSIQKKIYPSLPLLLSAEWRKEKLSFNPSKLNKDGSISMPPFPAKLPWKTYSFIDLLEQKIPKNDLQDKMVFIFYNGKKSSPLKFPEGKTYNPAEVIALLTDYLIQNPLHP